MNRIEHFAILQIAGVSLFARVRPMPAGLWNSELYTRTYQLQQESALKCVIHRKMTQMGPYSTIEKYLGVLGLNLDISYLDFSFQYFSLVPTGKCMDYTSIRL